MHYTRLGNSGLDVSKVCLGCMNFGDETPGIHDWSLGEAETRPIIERALELGINFFDTANAYSQGTSEEITGRLLRELANRDDVVIATKVYFPMRRGRNAIGLSRKSIMAELEHSLRRLGTDYIDLYQIHRFDEKTPVEETMRAFDDAIASGKVRYIGASSMWAWQFSKMQHAAEARGWPKFVSMQNQYSLLQREEEREMLPLCADQGVGAIPYSPLARGLLTRDWDESTPRHEVDPLTGRRFDRSRDEVIAQEVAKVAEEREVPRAQIALAWVMQHPVVAAPIIGASKVGHVEDAVEASEIELTDNEIQRLEAHYTPRANLF